MAASLHSEVENGGIDEEMKELEQEIDAAEIEIEKQRIKVLKPIYEKRRKVFKKIPKFWSQVLLKPAVAGLSGQFLTDNDYSVVQYIDDVIVEKDEDSVENFTIILSFSENEFFKNKELKKEFIVGADGQRKIKSTPIEWFDGRDYTKKRKTDEDEGFIKWFTEETADEYSWEIGKAFKDEVYPRAWKIYNEEDEEDEEDEEAIEEESEEDLEEIPSKKRVKQN